MIFTALRGKWRKGQISADAVSLCEASLLVWGDAVAPTRASPETSGHVLHVFESVSPSENQGNPQQELVGRSKPRIRSAHGKHQRGKIKRETDRASRWILNSLGDKGQPSRDSS